MDISASKVSGEWRKIDDIWLKAAIAGGLWASVEIIAGSFLHNIRIPMAGTILASFGIILMVAFYQIWPERGLIWRAGIICALMKSVSPSAVILGPMTGILMEAFLLDATIKLLGRNLFAYLTGGAIALFSALLHKIFSLLLLYGVNILNIYLNLFAFASRQINIPEADPWMLLLILTIIYFAAGAIAGFLGYLAGKRSIMTLELPTGSGSIIVPEKTTSFQPFDNVSGNYSLFLFTLHLLSIPIGMALINSGNRLFAYPLVIVYTLFCLWYYKTTLRRIKKPLFWFQLIVILILAAIFLGTFENGSVIPNRQSIMAGFDMNIRALLVVAGFSAFGSELRNPKIINFIIRKGLGQLYISISLAFSVLPEMTAQLSSPAKFIANPFLTLNQMIARAQLLLAELRQNNDY